MLGFDSNHYRLGNYLRAPLEESFYNVDVTPAELWQQVGKILERARHDRKWRPADVERHGGPSYKTVQAIEVGDVGTVDMLDKCATALGISIVDVIHSVLASKVTPLSPEAAQIVRKYAETTVAGRHALVALAIALPTEAPPAETPTPAADEGAPVKPRLLRSALPATTRRKPR
jgi:hypothetical protein